MATAQTLKPIFYASYGDFDPGGEQELAQM